MQHLRCEEGHIHKVMWLLSLSLSLPSERLGSPPLGCLLQPCIAIYANDNFDRQPICLQTARRLVDGQCRKRPPLWSGISLVSHFLPSALGGFSPFYLFLYFFAFI